jgi:hypothetical protein
LDIFLLKVGDSNSKPFTVMRKIDHNIDFQGEEKRLLAGRW